MPHASPSHHGKQRAVPHPGRTAEFTLALRGPLRPYLCRCSSASVRRRLRLPCTSCNPSHPPGLSRTAGLCNACTPAPCAELIVAWPGHPHRTMSLRSRMRVHCAQGARPRKAGTGPAHQHAARGRRRVSVEPGGPCYAAPAVKRAGQCCTAGRKWRQRAASLLRSARDSRRRRRAHKQNIAR